MFMHVFDCYKTSKMFDKAVKKDSKMLKVFLTTLKLIKCVKKLLKISV